MAKKLWAETAGWPSALALPFPAGKLDKLPFHSANETQVKCISLQIYLTQFT